MMKLACDVINALGGKSLVTAESCTGGGIGAALTAVPGSSEVYKGGIICYTNWVKHNILGVDAEMLERFGAVSEPVAKAMAIGARKVLEADVAVSVTGLAGPGGDAYGNPVGRVYIAAAERNTCVAEEHTFPGDRDAVRRQAVEAALRLVLKMASGSEK